MYYGNFYSNIASQNRPSFKNNSMYVQASYQPATKPSKNRTMSHYYVYDKLWSVYLMCISAKYHTTNISIITCS